MVLYFKFFASMVFILGIHLSDLTPPSASRSALHTEQHLPAAAVPPPPQPPSTKGLVLLTSASPKPDGSLAISLVKFSLPSNIHGHGWMFAVARANQTRG